MIKTRKRGHATEYYLLAKDGDSILYNGWFAIERLGAPEEVGTSLSNLPECLVSSWTIRNRINNPELYDYACLWDLVCDPPQKLATRGETYVKRHKQKSRRMVQYELPERDPQYIENMKLFKPGSLAHTVR